MHRAVAAAALRVGSLLLRADGDAVRARTMSKLSLQ
jgi:hypothetical protein